MSLAFKNVKCFNPDVAKAIQIRSVLNSSTYLTSVVAFKVAFTKPTLNLKMGIPNL